MKLNACPRTSLTAMTPTLGCPQILGIHTIAQCHFLWRTAKCLNASHPTRTPSPKTAWLNFSPRNSKWVPNLTLKAHLFRWMFLQSDWWFQFYKTYKYNFPRDKKSSDGSTTNSLSDDQNVNQSTVNGPHLRKRLISRYEVRPLTLRHLTLRPNICRRSFRETKCHGGSRCSILFFAAGINTFVLIALTPQFNGLFASVVKVIWPFCMYYLSINAMKDVGRPCQV